MKGRTKWLPRHTHPVRPGTYECAVRLAGMRRLTLWMLEWDGRGFLVPVPMEVWRWRGMTRAAHRVATGQGGSP
jgi:hypothetical protein